MSRPTKTDIQKKRMIEALEKTLGVVTRACQIVGIHRSTFYDWYNNDEEFRRQVDGIQEIAIDFVEHKLFEQIKNGNTTATIFYLKTKGKKRGYIEKIEHDFNNIQPIQIRLDPDTAQDINDIVSDD